jgi:hypothetical protein
MLSKQEILGILNDHLYVDGTRVGGKVNAADALVRAGEREAAAALRRLTADLDRYRYAVQWASADAWDAGGEMRARFEWARGEDRGAHLDNNRAAEIGQVFLKTTGRALLDQRRSEPETQ